MTNEEMMRPCTLPKPWFQSQKPFCATLVADFFWHGYYSSDDYHFEELRVLSDVPFVRDAEHNPSMHFCLETRKQILASYETNNIDGTNPNWNSESTKRKILQEAITTIADALNAPVLATDAVLAGLPKDANLRTGNHSLERNDKGEWGYYDFNENWEDQADFWVFVPIDASDRIFYDRCSKTAEYLRQFTLEGVRKETKDV